LLHIGRSDRARNWADWEAQKAARELSGWMDHWLDKFRDAARHGFRLVRHPLQSRDVIESVRVSPPELRIDNLSRGRQSLTGLPDPTQMVRTYLKIV
jgi:hypothetical protein